MQNQAKTVHLQGGIIRYTMLADSCFEIISGRVLVYILPMRAGHADRRFLLYEAQAGERIPALCWDAPYSYDDDEMCTWCFGLVAVDTAELYQYNQAMSEEEKKEFARRAKMRSVEFEEFENCCIEEYQLRLTKELRNLYTAEQEYARVHTRNLETIFELFRPAKQRYDTHEATGNALYDAIARICDMRRIPIISLDSVISSSGRHFTVNDVARLSHFITRDIILEEKWYVHDSGAILAYYAESGQAVACLPDGPTHYRCYDPVTGESVRVTPELAAALKPQAQMIYRPFPARKLGLKDIVAFGLQDIYLRDILTFLLLALAGTAIGLLLPYINEQLYDLFIPMGDSSGLLQVCWVVLACTTGNITFTIVKNLATFRSMSSMKYSIQSAAYDRVFNMPESFFRDYDCADLAQRVMSLATIFQTAVQVLLTTGLTALFSLMYLGRMFSYSSKLSGISLLMLALTMALIGILGWRQTRYEAKLLELDGVISSRLYQILNGIDKLRIAGVEERALFEYLKPYTDSKKIAISKEKLENFVTVITTAMTSVFSLVLYYLMIKNNTNLSIGAFMGFTAAFGSFSGAMLQAVSSILTVNDVVPLYRRVKPMLEQVPEIEADTELPGELTGDIEISNVTFSYSKEGSPVLKDLSLHIHPGEYIGVVGPSGCGKSTLLKLLLGFEKPQSGKIFYDGRDIDGIDKRELRKKFGVVLQDGNLISGSIYENIVITAPNATMKQVKQVIADVGLERDIEQMPMGLHTVLSEDSGTISGGQQQRILIARAIVGKPKIIYFDEATSALDNVTQSQVTESLEKLHATRFVIAHRLSTIMGCDRIIVLNKGTIQECGTYDELMQQHGLFYELASRQQV